MNCDQAWPMLPLRAYGDATPDEAALAAHLAGCAACRADLESLSRTHTVLDSLPVPDVCVDVAAIVQGSVTRQAIALRRWKRMAGVAAALAAGFLLVLLARPEIRMGDGALVVRWQPAAEIPAIPSAPASDPEQIRRLDLLAQLVRAMAEDAETHDRDRTQQIESLRLRLDLVQTQGDGRWQDIQRDMGVLYRAQFVRKE